MSKVMYAVYRTKRVTNDNTPLAIFERRDRADEFIKTQPSWLQRSRWVQRVVINRIDQAAYDLIEHVGYKSKQGTKS